MITSNNGQEINFSYLHVLTFEGFFSEAVLDWDVCFIGEKIKQATKQLRAFSENKAFHLANGK